MGREELFDNLSYDDQIAIKDKLIRILLKRNADYKKKIDSYIIPKEQYNYTEDYIFVEDALLLEGTEISTQMDSLINDFCEIFEEKDNVKDPEMKAYIQDLLNKEDITRADFSTILNLFRRDANMKKMMIFHDQYTVEERKKMKSVFKSESEYFEQVLGISLKEVNEILKLHPEMMNAYSEFSASYHLREYERECLTLQTDVHNDRREKELEALIEKELREKVSSERKKRYGLNNGKLPGGYGEDNLIVFLKRIEYDKQKLGDDLVKRYFHEKFNYDKIAQKLMEKLKIRNRLDIERGLKESLIKIIDTIIDMNSKGKTTEEIKNEIFSIRPNNKTNLVGVIRKMLPNDLDGNKAMNALSTFVTDGVLKILTTDYVKRIENEIEGNKSVWKEEIIQNHKAPEMLFRAQDASFQLSEEPGISSNDSDSRLSPQIHIEQGSKSNMKTSYISASKIFAISSTYLCAFPASKAYEKPRASVYLINLDKVYELMSERLKEINDENMFFAGESEFLKQLLEIEGISEEQKAKIAERLRIAKKEKVSVYKGRAALPEGVKDFSDNLRINHQERVLKSARTTLISSILDKEKKPKKYSKIKFAPASREVLFKGIIPKDALVEIDPIMYDSLLLTTNKDKKQENFLKDIATTESPFDARNVIKTLMTNNINETFGLDIHELYFLQEYYLNNRPVKEILSAYEYDNIKTGKRNYIPERMYEQSMRTKVIKKLLENAVFRNAIKEKGIELPDHQNQEITNNMIIPSTGVSRHESTYRSGLDEKKANQKKISSYSVYDQADSQEIELFYEPDISSKGANDLKEETIFVSTGIDEKTTLTELNIGVKRTDMKPKNTRQRIGSVWQSGNVLNTSTQESILKFSLKKMFADNFDAKQSTREAVKKLSENIKKQKSSNQKSQSDKKSQSKSQSDDVEK